MGTAIYFDLDGTLLTFAEPYEEVVADVLADYVTEPSEAVETYFATFDEHFDALESDPYRAGMVAVCEHEDIEADTDPDALVDALREAECERTQVSDDARASLDALGEANALGVLTDGVADFQRAKLDQHDLLDHFETVIASYDVGAHKPDASMFDRAREAIDAEEYVMVGDSDADIEGARAAGFTPVRVERGEDVPDFWTTLRALA
ncbi:HAD-superfamily hydrolase, subfamily IA, variant 1 [Halorhabdus utahensis DSM 12940]|uniref:HAD-superfamily hydrolase, subfamily IA, variant 1 n=1 Tax=Halorhabdus utahensis (strain DSM 12940 / JCM 11049 / AX-2) TaxID=519442 RepID=C7NU09_HALUD|nr:HAD family hydrolase [Halorhabdus utahensis]ACV12254.1 HAD-superfamily hydrolase, subfamily IA, variant 1 [Halorhabdus utahensis DSM 12940]